MGLTDLRALALAAALLSGCGLGIRGIQSPGHAERVQEQKRAEQRAAEKARHERAHRRCDRETNRDVAAEREKNERAIRELDAAAERLRVAEELGDPATIHAAMKDRDEAKEAVRLTWWPTDKNQRTLHEECVRRFLKLGL